MNCLAESQIGILKKILPFHVLNKQTLKISFSIIFPNIGNKKAVLHESNKRSLYIFEKLAFHWSFWNLFFVYLMDYLTFPKKLRESNLKDVVNFWQSVFLFPALYFVLYIIKLLSIILHVESFKWWQISIFKVVLLINYNLDEHFD